MSAYRSAGNESAHRVHANNALMQRNYGVGVRLSHGRSQASNTAS